ncbi:MAG: DUF805 domain-containing protein [Betaproteobacteria bacterium]|nr:DUF805 domain-containing protein [Betaproteobacteria bacterium]
MGGFVWERLFSFRGRMSRRSFWWTGVAVGAVFVAGYVLLGRSFGRAAVFALYPPFLWVGLAICAKRMHDRGHAAGWLAVILIPAVGPLLLFLELALMRGTQGENDYGPDPREVRRDYFTVR